MTIKIIRPIGEALTNSPGILLPLILIIYLFANESAHNPYPRFGFQRVLEHQAITEETITGKGSTEIQKLNLDNSDDWRLFCDIIAATRPVSQKLSHLNGQWLIMFHCLSFLGSKIYYLPEQEIVVIKENIDNVIYIHDIFCPKRYEFDSKNECFPYCRTHE